MLIKKNTYNTSLLQFSVSLLFYLKWLMSIYICCLRWITIDPYNTKVEINHLQGGSEQSFS